MYVAAGDSNTHRQGVLSVYPWLVRVNDSAHFTGGAAGVINSGVRGDTTDDLLSGLDSLVLRHTPTVTSLMFGTNDHATSAGEPLVPLTRFEANLHTAIKRIPGRLILITPPYVQASETRSLTILRQYVDVIWQVARLGGAQVLDAFSITGDLCGWSDSVWVEKYASDGTHLNNAAHAAIYAKLLPLLIGLGAH